MAKANYAGVLFVSQSKDELVRGARAGGDPYVVTMHNMHTYSGRVEVHAQLPGNINDTFFALAHLQINMERLRSPKCWLLAIESTPTFLDIVRRST